MTELKLRNVGKQALLVLLLLRSIQWKSVQVVRQIGRIPAWRQQLQQQKKQRRQLRRQRRHTRSSTWSYCSALVVAVTASWRRPDISDVDDDHNSGHVIGVTWSNKLRAPAMWNHWSSRSKVNMNKQRGCSIFSVFVHGLMAATETSISNNKSR